MKGWMELLQKKRKEEMFFLATKFRCGMLIQIDLRENPFVIFIFFFKKKTRLYHTSIIMVIYGNKKKSI